MIHIIDVIAKETESDCRQRCLGHLKVHSNSTFNLFNANHRQNWLVTMNEGADHYLCVNIQSYFLYP